MGAIDPPLAKFLQGQRPEVSRRQGSEVALKRIHRIGHVLQLSLGGVVMPGVAKIEPQQVGDVDGAGVFHRQGLGLARRPASVGQPLGDALVIGPPAFRGVVRPQVAIAPIERDYGLAGWFVQTVTRGDVGWGSGHARPPGSINRYITG